MAKIKSVKGKLEMTGALVVTINYDRREIIDDFQNRVKWTSEGQRPVEAALQVDPG